MKSPRVGFVSLGCPKALVDSERILTQLRAEGYVISDNYSDASIVVVNTCGFIQAAVEESLEAITEALDENGRVIVTGCLGTRNRESEHPAAFPRVGCCNRRWFCRGHKVLKDFRGKRWLEPPAEAPMARCSL